MNTLVLGSVVYSVRGRDSGRYYMVVKVIDDQFVLISDGEKRLLETPKKKRYKHLKHNGVVIDKISKKLAENSVVYNQEIRSALKEFNAVEL